MITIKNIQNNATVIDGSNTISLGANGSYTCLPPEEKRAFIIEIDTTIIPGNQFNAPNAPTDEFKLGFRLTTYNVEIDWGDGSDIQREFNSSASLFHTYPTPGVYQIKVYGYASFYYFGSYFNRITKILQWGKLRQSTFNNSYARLNVTFPQDEEVLMPSDSRNSFLECNFINYPRFNTYSLFNASTMFQNSNFDNDIGYWYMRQANNLVNMFRGTSMTVAHCDAIFTGWQRWDSATSTPGIILQPNVSIHMGTTDYTRGGDAEDAFNYLVNTLNWTIIFS